ncbi:hypothetical protein EDC04DRAFT_290716 [Pisolithus marmoratus]|nr:hypothetical protein EDC04DRAFT_290716 [Pisolithus marmoratus]
MMRSSGFGLRSAGFGLRSAGFGLRSAGFGLRSAGFGLRSAGFVMRSSRFVLRSAGFIWRSSRNAWHTFSEYGDHGPNRTPPAPSHARSSWQVRSVTSSRRIVSCSFITSHYHLDASDIEQYEDISSSSCILLRTRVLPTFTLSLTRWPSLYLLQITKLRIA